MKKVDVFPRVSTFTRALIIPVDSAGAFKCIPEIINEATAKQNSLPRYEYVHAPRCINQGLTGRYHP